jgi:hypothetical protein
MRLDWAAPTNNAADRGEQATRGHRGRIVRLALLSLLALWRCLGWAPGAASALPIDDFALGDSVASGYGLADDETACRRSVLAYLGLVSARLQDTFVVSRFELLACSGTMTASLDRQVVDVYIALQLPDHRLWFVHADGSITPEARPYLGQWSVVPFRAEVFHHTVTGAETPGPYQWLAAFTEPGTGTIIGATAQAPFTISAASLGAVGRASTGGRGAAPQGGDGEAGVRRPRPPRSGWPEIR